MAGQLKVGGNIIASHSGVEGAGEVTLQNVTLGDSAVPSRSMNFRNKIINGNFDIWQRGTSFTISNSTNTYSTDRWRFLGSPFTGTLTRENFSSGQTEVPNSPDYFAKWTVTTNPASNIAFGQYIENVRTLAGKTATLSLYLKSSSTISANSLQIRYRQVTGGTGVTLNAINIGEITTSWQKFTFQLNIPSLVGETLGAPNASYLILDILSPTAHTSAFDLSIAQVQLEEGTVPTPFEHRPIGTELALCQRYYEVGVVFGQYKSSDDTSGWAHYKVTKRVNPSIQIFPPDNSQSNYGYYYSTVASDRGNRTINEINPTTWFAGQTDYTAGFFAIMSSFTPSSLNDATWVGNYRADAEIY